MANTIYLGHCSSPSHKRDKHIVEEISEIDGVYTVFDSHVDFDGKQYCIVAETKSTDPRELDRIRKEIESVDDLKEVIELRPA